MGAAVKIRKAEGVMEYLHLVEDQDRHGNVRLYFRKRGHRKIRMRAAPGTDAFEAEYRRALAGDPEPSKKAPHDGSLHWLVMRYIQAPEFEALAASTQLARRRVLESICCEPASEDDATPLAGMPYRTMPPSIVRVLRNRKAAFKAAANIRIKALSRLFSWAIENDLAETNPAREVKRLQVVTTGHHTWTVEEVAQFEARHPAGSKPRLALALLLFLGVRRSDVVKLGRQNMKGAWITFTVTKGQTRKIKVLQLPVLPALKTIIAATPSEHLTFLVTAYGRPFTANGFGMRMRAWCDEAGLPQCSAHGLRKAGATIAAERGATPHQLMAIYGWDSIAEAETYTKAASQRLLAGEAMHLIERREDESVPLSDTDVSHRKAKR